MPILESAKITFSPKEKAGLCRGYEVHGAINTKDPAKCVLQGEGRATSPIGMEGQRQDMVSKTCGIFSYTFIQLESHTHPTDGDPSTVLFFLVCSGQTT